MTFTSALALSPRTSGLFEQDPEGLCPCSDLGRPACPLTWVYPTAVSSLHPQSAPCLLLVMVSLKTPSSSRVEWNFLFFAVPPPRLCHLTGRIRYEGGGSPAGMTVPHHHFSLRGVSRTLRYLAAVLQSAGWSSCERVRLSSSADLHFCKVIVETRQMDISGARGVSPPELHLTCSVLSVSLRIVPVAAPFFQSFPQGTVECFGEESHRL